MAYREVSKQIDKNLYPDVVRANGLPDALANALADLASPLKVNTVEDFIPYAQVAEKSRVSQMYIAAQERLFLFDFWSDGVLYGNGVCKTLTDAAQAINFWICEKPSIAVMEERFALFQPSEQGKAHEAGQAVKYQWVSLLKSWENTPDPSMSPKPLIEAASKCPELRRLFPFTSLYRLCFSRTTGYPFTDDCPHAVPIGNGRFRAYSAKHEIVNRNHSGFDYQDTVYEVIGEGNVEEVIEMLVANLPPNCGAAISGTAEDLTSEEEKSAE